MITKRRIGRRVYNVETAREKKSIWRESSKTIYIETLFKKRNGEFFVDGWQIDKKTRVRKNHIFPISYCVANSEIWN